MPALISRTISPPNMGTNFVSIAPLLAQLHGESPSTSKKDVAMEIAAALTLIFENQLSPVQCASLLTILHYSGKERDPLVLAKCGQHMRDAAFQVDREALRQVVKRKGRREGEYHGGLCDIVGTGGDGHSTFNVSTTASILASSLLLISKHGNRASSSTSGSADLLQAVQPKGPHIDAITANTLPAVYEDSNYAFLFAPKFHPGMSHVAPIRKDLGFRTIFNILGPLANPVEGDIEARIVGVAERGLGSVFAEALFLSGARKGMVVCGAENLDEISCAGKTFCWRLNGSRIDQFELAPGDFGLPPHSLTEVGGGRLPHENAEMLTRLLKNELDHDNPVLHFVLINTAALFAISGICEADSSDMGHGDQGNVITERGPGGLRWKEGLRRARWAIQSGEANSSLEKYIDATHKFYAQT